MKFLLLLFLLPFQLFAQSVLPESKELAGVWTGSLYNDTTQKYIHYELAINETNGKLNGYSHTTFIIDSVSNIGVKEVKVKLKKGVISVEDEKLIANDYAAPPAKGVRTFIDLVFSENDTAQILEGTWKTNRTREYNAITGTVKLERSKKARQTLIISKLEQLGVAGNLSFLTGDKNPSSSIVVTEKQRQIDPTNTEILTPSTTIISGTTESGKIIPDTTITDPELVVKIYGPVKKKAISNSDTTNTPAVKTNAAKEPGSKKENVLQNQKAENKISVISNSAEGKKEIAKNINSLQPATSDLNTISSGIKKKEIGSSEQKLSINKSLESQNKIAATKDVVIAQRNEVPKSDSEIETAKQKHDSRSADNERVDSLVLNKNATKGKDVVIVENKTSVNKEGNIKTSGIVKNETGSIVIKNVVALPNQSKSVSDSGLVNKTKNGIGPIVVLEKLPTNTQKKDVAENSHLIKGNAVNQKETSSTLDIEKNDKPAKELVKAIGNQQQTENAQSSINPLIKKINTNAAAEVLKRDIETIRTVAVTQDSVVLSLYDNGTVDGDTVSILVNGVVVMPKVGLLTKAVNKTIYLTPEMGESINVIMYAENLGSYPPNTGLLIVRDGDINYEIRFSGDLKKNSAIILKRKNTKLEH